MSKVEGETIYEARNTGQLGVGGCLTAIMFGVFGVIPVGLIVFTLPEFGEMPVGLTIFYIVAFFPLAALLVLRRLMQRYALRVGRPGWVELVLPFKTIRLAGTDLAAIKVSTITAATPGAANVRRSYAYFLGADRSVNGTIALAPFGEEQWRGFVAALAQVRPDVTVG